VQQLFSQNLQKRKWRRAVDTECRLEGAHILLGLNLAEIRVWSPAPARSWRPASLQQPHSPQQTPLNFEPG